MKIPHIIHPCDAWARSAGRNEWSVALAEMKAGALLAGRAPTGEKSMLGLKLFMEQVEAEGLHIYVSDSGDVVVGLKEKFPENILAAQDREMHRFASRMASRG
jgi:hypothetical protein